MGATMKDIKSRIKSVESTMQITKAMELVSSSKLRKAKERAEKARPFFNALYETIAEVSAELRNEPSVYTAKRGDKAPLYVVVAGDRGLAGGYNSNVFKLVEQELQGKAAYVIPIGKKSVDHYERSRHTVVRAFPGIAEEIDYFTVAEVRDCILNLYQQDKIGNVYLVFTQFVTALTQQPTVLQILPLNLPQANDQPRKVEAAMTYEPSASAVFYHVMPQYVAGMIYGGIAESYASEQAARRTAMESATGNAEEMIESLSLSYNRARQAAITQELTEIVAGANAAT